MRDLIELAGMVLGRRTKGRPRARHDGLLVDIKENRRSEGININPILKHNPLPKVPPPSPPSINEADRVKKKDRITELEREVAELKTLLTNQSELMERLVRDLGELNRDIAPLLPRK